jgi:hemoglobin-like flavoprotein
MAIKKYEQQTRFVNEIGVNRGAGFTTAANEFKNRATAFDNILDAVSSTEIKRLKQEGALKGEKAAETIPYVQETVSTNVRGVKKEYTIYKRPEIPEYLTGKTSRATFDSVFTRRFKRDSVDSLRSIVNSIAESAISNGADPELYETEADGRIIPILNEYSPEFREVMQIEYQKIKDDRGVYVASKYNDAVMKNNMEDFKAEVNEFDILRQTRLSQGNTITDEDYENVFNSLELTNIVNKERKKNMLKEETQAMQNFFGKFNSYIESGVASKSIQGINSTKLLSLIKNPTLKQVTLKDGTVVTQEQMTNIAGNYRKKLENILTNYKEVYGSDVSKQNNSLIFADSLDKAFESDNTFPVTQFHSLNNAQKVKAFDQESFDFEYKRYAKTNNIDPTDLKTKNRVMLEKLNMLNPNVMNAVKSNLKFGNINKEMLGPINDIGSFIDSKGGAGNVDFLNEEEQTEVILINDIYVKNNYDADKTVVEYTEYKQMDANEKLSNVIERLGKTRQNINTYLTNKVRDVLGSKVKISSVDIQFVNSVQRKLQYELLNGNPARSDNELDLLIQKLAGITYTTSPVDSYQFGISNITGSDTLTLLSDSYASENIKVVAHPFEHYYGVGIHDIEMYNFTTDDLEDDNRLRQTFTVDTQKNAFIAMPYNTKKIDIYQDYFKKKMKGAVLDNGEALGTKYQRMQNVFEDGTLQVVPLLGGYTRPGQPPNYRLVHVDSNGDKRDVLNPDTFEEIILDKEELNEIKMNYITQEIIDQDG